jgi:ribosome maturation factor RimP
MITEHQIKNLTDQYLEGSDLFVVDIMLKPGNKISVFIDGDNRINIDACTKLSRYLESNLDRDSEDFDLTVSSSGADRPLKLPRQYKKNIGFSLALVTKSGEKITGKVLSANEQGIEIDKLDEKKSRKESEKSILKIEYSDIKSAKEVITFKK